MSFPWHSLPNCWKCWSKTIFLNYPSSSKARCGARIVFFFDFQNRRSQESKKSYPSLMLFSRQKEEPALLSKLHLPFWEAASPPWLRYPNQPWEARGQSVTEHPNSVPRKQAELRRAPPRLRKGNLRKKPKGKRGRGGVNNRALETELHNPKAERTPWWTNWNFKKCMLGPIIKIQRYY